jgi:arginine decarboxylase
METEREFQTQMRCPYFEVLMVDDLPAEEEESLRRRVRSRRRPDDDFIFDVVVVPTFEDALVASMVNFNLQAVVIGYGFPYRSLYVPELVARRFFEGAWKSAASNCPSPSAASCSVNRLPSCAPNSISIW